MKNMSKKSSTLWDELRFNSRKMASSKE